MRRKPSLVWIFSFADLAFLLVLALAVIPATDKDYVQLKLSEVASSDSLESAPGEKHAYRLYVDISSEKWGVSLQKRGKVKGEWENIPEAATPEELEARLIEIRKEKQQPEFVAAEGSRTGDMLMALSLIQKVWPNSQVWTTVQTKIHSSTDDK